MTTFLTAEQVRSLVGTVPDPEIPVITIADLGILRDVSLEDASDGMGGPLVTVTITPTYSGCPAMEEIRADIVSVLAAHGIDRVVVEQVLVPAWTTDWMSAEGRDKLAAYGIAPPRRRRGPVAVQLGMPTVAVVVVADLLCPQCGSADTEELSRFASTSCKSMWRCRSCREPFDHFKDH